VQELNSKHLAKKENKEKNSKANSPWQAEGEPVASTSQRAQEITRNQLATASERRAQVREHQRSLTMANNILARRVKAAKTPQS